MKRLGKHRSIALKTLLSRSVNVITLGFYFAKFVVSNSPTQEITNVSHLNFFEFATLSTIYNVLRVA